MKECIVVLGMHRSGTSVLAGLVSMQGYYLGASEMPKREDNPKGFYENFKVYQLNQSILLDHDTSWDEYSFTMDKISPTNLHSYELKARKIIKEEFGPVNRIFIKDPRMCLLFPLWEKVLTEMGFAIKVVLAYRSPMEVANSLQSRNEFEIEKSLMIWSHHFFQAEKTSRKYPRILVRYDDDISDLDAFIKILNEFLGIELSEGMIESSKELYTPKLKHHQLHLDNLSDELPSYFKRFISILKSGELGSEKELDNIIMEFYNSKNYFLHNESSLKNNIRLLEEEVLTLKNEVEKQKNEVERQKNEVLFKLKEIDQQQIRINNAKQDNVNLSQDYERKLSKKIAEKNNSDRELKNKIAEISDRDEKLIIGEQIFNRAFTKPELKKKFKRTLKGRKYYKYKRLFSPFSKGLDKQLLEDKSVIVESGLFSSYFYLTQNPDVWRAGLEPLNHFCKHGWKEGRNPSRSFNCKAYLKTNGDVAKSGKNPLVHYIKYGKREGRSAESELIPDDEIENIDIDVTDLNCIALKQSMSTRPLPSIPEKTDDILVSILVLNRDGLEHLKILIPALYEYTQDVNFELIVVDNASTDDSIKYLDNCGYDLNLSIIKNSVNETFSKANNQAAKQAKGKYLVLLNNDIEPMRGWLHHLISISETHDDIGSVGCRLIYPFKESFKNSCTVQHAGIAFKDEIGFLRPYNQFNGAMVESEEVLRSGYKSAVTAACLLVKAEVYNKVCGLDEGYNYGFEDVDFGLKLMHSGYRNYYCADSVLLHHEFGTQKKNNREEVIARREKNAALLHRKWGASLKSLYWKEKLFNGSNLVAEKPLKVAITVTDYGPKVTAGDYFTAQEIAHYLESFGWTVMYLSRLKDEWYKLDNDVDVLISLLDAYDLSLLPKRTTRLYKVAWTRNWFDRWCEMSCFNDYDLVFASSIKSCEYVSEHSRQEPMLLPIASNPIRFVEKQGCVNPEFYDSDICFTGSYWDSPRDIMTALSKESLEKYRFNIYGANWDKFEKFKPHNKGFISYENIPHAYHHTKIVIDDANHVTKPYGAVNSRVFDALMSGALVITNGIEGSKDLFSGELPFYETSKELDDLLDFYLNDESAREAKVKQLKSLILKNHTYKHRADSIRNALESRFLSKSIAIKIPAPTWEGSYSWGDYHMAVLLKRQLENKGFYVLLQILPEWDNDEGMECDAVIVFRGLSRYVPKPHQINLMWNISHPDKVSLDEYEEYDKVFIASEFWAKKIGEQISTPVEVMLQCTDLERFKEPTDEEKKQFKQQILFVGNSRDVYRKVLKDLLPTEYDLAVYGKNWNKLINKKYIKGNYIANDELYAHYGAADILLNDHWDDMRRKGFISNRIFDALACGAFIVTDKVDSMGEVEDFVKVYETEEELKSILDYYISNSDERITFSKKGVSFIANKHTFKERAEQFVSSLVALESSKVSLKFNIERIRS